MTEKYNGWTNWQTWNTVLWMDNDESAYHHRLGMTPVSGIGRLLAESIVIQAYPSGTPDMDSSREYADVDWQAIADAWNEE